MKYSIYSVLLIVVIFGCGGSEGDNSNPEPEQVNPITVEYTESADDFPNPERGFYEYSETYGSSFSSLSESNLKAYRNPKNGSGASYKTVSTLVFRYYVFDSFKGGPLSQTFIDQIKQDYVTARKAGVKLIPRFTYTLNANAGSCAEGFICPPYGDAPKSIVLNHIEQLKPILQDNADVIACIQMGFIGVWGENYYTDYFGDASSSGQGKLLDNNWQDRFDVLKALLDATPKDIMVQVRYPQMKQRFIYGIDAAADSAPLTELEAFNESDKARIAYHNDCFLASTDDYGTYADYGNSSSPRKSVTSIMRKYFSNDSKFVVVGGETCGDDYSPQNDCEPTGKAVEEFKTMHYSFLNADYNSSVDNDWATGGCIEEIKKNLGYRLVLKTGEYPEAVKQSGKLHVKIEIENVGFASPFKAHPVVLVLRSTSSDKEYKLDFDTDIRKWFTGTTTLEEDFQLSSDYEKGDFELLLSIPDKYESIANRTEYCIRLANTDTWEETTGLNDLKHVVSIK